MNKILTVLPYKENYAKGYAAAASLWVNEFLKYSKFKRKNLIIGSTKHTAYLSNNYININLDESNKFSSTTKLYCNKIISFAEKKNFDIIEIHNRPTVYLYLKDFIKTKYILYFHNDPQKMNGSKSLSDRVSLYNSVEKIIFVSKWVQKRFFEGFESYNIKNTSVIYPSISKPKKNKKKHKKIIFVGKLNKSKGYDLYVESVNKILEKHKKWEALSIGDERREEIIVKHKRHFNLGYLTHAKVLDYISKCEIAVVPSKWEEPFGRTALESSSRGCLTIMSGNGGLPETTDHGVILKELTVNELYNKIDFYISNPKSRKKIQKLAFKNVKHLIKANSKLIDKIRDSLFGLNKLNFIKGKYRILNIYNIGQKINHRIYNISLGKKFTNGFIRNNHDVIEISDRDFIKQNRSFGLKNVSKFNDYLIETFRNYNPDLVFFGHSENITNKTLENFREIKKNILISHWNEDPMMSGLSDSKNNINKIKSFEKLVDRTFISTAPEVVQKSKTINNLSFFFIPVDRNIECYNVYKLNPEKDLFYAMSHGVNRGLLKKGKIDERINFLKKLTKKLSNVDFDFYGYDDVQPIWADKFYNALTNCKMGLNLSRGNPTKYYSSNRIASLIGNGLLTFIDKKTKLDDFFSNKEIIFYKNIDDLSDKINYFKNKPKERIRIAEQGQKKYFKLFNEKKTASYLIDKTLGKNVKIID